MVCARESRAPQPTQCTSRRQTRHGALLVSVCGVCDGAGAPLGAQRSASASGRSCSRLKSGVNPVLCVDASIIVPLERSASDITSGAIHHVIMALNLIYISVTGAARASVSLRWWRLHEDIAPPALQWCPHPKHGEQEQAWQERLANSKIKSITSPGHISNTFFR